MSEIREVKLTYAHRETDCERCSQGGWKKEKCDETNNMNIFCVWWTFCKNGYFFLEEEEEEEEEREREREREKFEILIFIYIYILKSQSVNQSVRLSNTYIYILDRKRERERAFSR